jgi:hypothetical protein
MKIELPLDGTARNRLRPASRAVFQSKYAFEGMLLIAQEDRFYPSQVAEMTGCEPNFAGTFIKRLATAGLVEPLDHQPGQNRKYYRRLPSPIWDFCLRWARELLSEPDAPITRLSEHR